MHYRIHEDSGAASMYGYTGAGSSSNNRAAAPNERLSPVIDPRQNLLAQSDTASIQKDCGFDNICIPELSVQYNA